MIRRTRSWLVVLLTVSVVPAIAGQIYSVFYDSRFGTIDDTTGMFTQIGTLPLAKSAGIAWDNGIFYAQDLNGDLIAIDPVSGTGSVLGGSGQQLSSVAFAGAYNGLFEIDSLSNLYSINPDTGAATMVGATGLAASNGYWDTSLSDDGTSMYLTAGGAGATDELYQIDPTTGIATDLGNTGVTGIAGSVVVNGYLDLFQYGAAPNYIYSAPIGSSDFTPGPLLAAQIVDGGTVADIFSPLDIGAGSNVAEPLPLVLLASGVLALLLRVRNRRKTLAERSALP